MNIIIHKAYNPQHILKLGVDVFVKRYMDLAISYKGQLIYACFCVFVFLNFFSIRQLNQESRYYISINFNYILKLLIKKKYFGKIKHFFLTSHVFSNFFLRNFSKSFNKIQASRIDSHKLPNLRSQETHLLNLILVIISSIVFIFFYLNTFISFSVTNREHLTDEK